MSFYAIPVAVIGVVLSTVLYGVFKSTNCQDNECCDTTWIGLDKTELKMSLDKHLFGQHIAKRIVSVFLHAT